MRTILVGTVLLSMAVAACSIEAGGSRSSSMPPQPSPSPTPTLNPNQLALASRSPAPRAEPTITAGSSASIGPQASPELPHADPDLEALLPTALDGIALRRFSVPGATFTGGSDMCILICGDEPYRYAKELGITIDDVSIGFATDEGLTVGIIAYRAKGAPTDRLIPARVAIGGYSGHSVLPGFAVVVAGRPATYLEHAFGKGEYLMTRHDALFIVLGEAPAADGSVPANVTVALAAVP